jgi:hypothetical protein
MIKMPMTKLQEKARKKYITVKEFQNQYSLSKSQAYKILARPEFDETKIKAGERSIRIDLDRAFEIMQQIFS